MYEFVHPRSSLTKKKFTTFSVIVTLFLLIGHQNLKESYTGVYIRGPNQENSSLHKMITPLNRGKITGVTTHTLN